MNNFARLSTLCLVPLLLAVSTPVQAVVVTTELALVMDISGSVDALEYNLQRQGYVNAFNNPSVQNRVENSPDGVAVAVYLFSTLATANRVNMGDADYVGWSAPILSWTLLENATDAANFATAIGNIGRPIPNTNAIVGDTNIADGILAAASGLNNNGFEGRKVIDVSTDGVQNSELNGTQPNDGCKGGGLEQFQQVCFDIVEMQRDAAGLDDIIINGIAIQTENTFGFGTLSEYMTDHVIIGDGSFVLAVDDFSAPEFGAAIADKIDFELTAPVIPLPGAVYLFLSGLLGLAGLARRRQQL